MVEVKEKKEVTIIEEAKRVSERFAQLPAEKKSIVIAFLNGMEVQKSIDEARA